MGWAKGTADFTGVARSGQNSTPHIYIPKPAMGSSGHPPRTAFPMRDSQVPVEGAGK